AAERDSKALRQRRGAAGVLARIADTTRREHGQQLGAGAGGPPARDVHGRRAWLEPNRRAGAPCSPAEILVLAVHEEALVEALEPLEERTANEKAGARQPLGRARTFVKLGTATDLVRPDRTRPQTMEEKRLPVGGRKTRKPPKRVLQLTRVVEDSRADDADGRVFVQDRREAVERFAVDARIRVEEEDVLSFADPPARVAPAAEPFVGVEADSCDWKVRHSGDAVIRGGVVDDDHGHPLV